jgi:hypothetical protein
MNRGLGAGTVFLLVCMFGGSTQAEIGKATAQPGEWYWGLTGSAAATFGADRQVAQKRDINSFDDFQNVPYDDGSIWTLGLELGRTLPEPGAWVDRIEINFDASVTFRSAKDEETDAGLATSVPPPLEFGSDEGIDIRGDDTQIDLETRVSLKNVLVEDGHRLVLTSIEPFLRYQDTDGDSKISFKNGNSATRDDSIEAYYIGVQAAVEMEQPVAQSLNLIGRASAGVYYVDSDISARIVGRDEANDSGDAFGGRFGAALGFKVPLYANGASFSIVATADYFTDVATIEHSEMSLFAQPTRTKADFDDRFDIGARVGIVVPIH